MALKDKVALVVGGGNGIGRVTSKLLSEQGVKIMVADVDIESATKAAREINAAGGVAAAVRVDMTKEQEAVDMVKTTLDRFGQVDILLNIAGGSVGRYIRDKLGPFSESTKEEWDRIIDINLNGARNCTRAVIGHMMERRSGNVVCFSSVAGVTGLKNAVDYAAAKAGIIGFTKALAIEMAPYGVRVNCVTPSGVATERIQEYWTAPGPAPQAPGSGRGAGQGPENELSGFAMPEELASAVLFLVSDGSTHVSGQNIIFGVPPTR